MNYYIQYNVGKIKYLVNYFDGKTTHKDGSPLYHPGCFSNKKKMQKFEKELISQGYKYRS